MANTGRARSRAGLTVLHACKPQSVNSATPPSLSSPPRAACRSIRLTGKDQGYRSPDPSMR